MNSNEHQGLLDFYRADRFASLGTQRAADSLPRLQILTSARSETGVKYPLPCVVQLSACRFMNMGSSFCDSLFRDFHNIRLKCINYMRLKYSEERELV